MRVGLGGDFQRLKRALGVRMSPVLSGITMAVIAEIENKLTPYPPSSEANRPGGPGSRWYERGYGSRWVTMGGQLRGRKTSHGTTRRRQEPAGRIHMFLGAGRPVGQSTISPAPSNLLGTDYPVTREVCQLRDDVQQEVVQFRGDIIGADHGTCTHASRKCCRWGSSPSRCAPR